MGSPSIALLITAPEWRGSGSSFAKIATGLSRAGYRVVLITAAAGVTERLSRLGLEVHQMALHRTGWREVRDLARVLRGISAEMVLADSPRDLRLATLATLGRRCRLVFRYNLSGRSLPSDPVSRTLQQRMTALVYQSEYARRRALGTSPWLARVPARLIPNGYDGSRLAPDPDAGTAFRKTLSIPGDCRVVLSAAALYRDKGYPAAIHSMALLRDEPGILWLIAGEGQERALLESAARDAGIPVRFLGSLSERDFAAAVNGADLVLHPAPGELFPNVVAEAMAQGRAVIGVDSGATPELIGRDGEAGLLVPAGDPPAMAAAVRSLLGAPERAAALGAEARRRILEHYPLERMEHAYQSLAAEYLGPPSRSGPTSVPVLAAP